MKPRKDRGGSHVQSESFIDDLRVLSARGYQYKIDYATALGMSLSTFDRRITRMRLNGRLRPGILGQPFKIDFTEKEA